MQEKKQPPVWPFAIYIGAAIIGLIGVPLALRDRRYVEAVLWGAILVANLAGAIKYRRRAR